MLVKVGAKVVYHASRSVGHFHVAPAFSLAHIEERGVFA
jgi:hypothetical protein